MSTRDDLRTAVDEAKDVRGYIDTSLRLHLHDTYDAYGWWCHRCDMLALPTYDLTPDAPLVPGDGWCILCGLDPQWHGPPAPKERPVRCGILMSPGVTPIDQMLAKAIATVNAASPDPERGRYMMHPADYAAALDRWKRTGKMPWDA